MICKVCKRELDSPVCSFCGEDNSSLWGQGENGYDDYNKSANDSGKGKSGKTLKKKGVSKTF